MIQFKNINLKFKEKVILENFNLVVKKGEKILITGNSGKGKSTILKILLGFKVPNSGDILVKNIHLNEKTINSIRKNLSYMPQSTPFLNENIENIISKIFSYKANCSKILNYEKLFEHLNYFDLDRSILNKNINELSGGEKQRLAFIINILLNRDIWILDEITSSLDVDMKEKVTNYILNSDKTVILVSHDKTNSLEKFKKVNL